jgi:hypothetical protein
MKKPKDLPSPVWRLEDRKDQSRSITFEEFQSGIFESTRRDETEGDEFLESAVRPVG